MLLRMHYIEKRLTYEYKVWTFNKVCFFCPLWIFYALRDFANINIIPSSVPYIVIRLQWNFLQSLKYLTPNDIEIHWVYLGIKYEYLDGHVLLISH